jgi:hypothetical protein
MILACSSLFVALAVLCIATPSCGRTRTCLIRNDFCAKPNSINAVTSINTYRYASHFIIILIVVLCFDCSLIQFGGGKRMCIGSAFALLEAKIIFSMMLQRFELSLVPAQLVCPVVAITMRPRYGLQMICRPTPNAQPLAK